MLVVIVGAGASADGTFPSTLGENGRPPLTNELVAPGKYQSTIAEWPPVGQLITRLRDSLRALGDATSSVALETELGRIAAEAQGSVPVARQLLAFRFYVQEIVKDVSIRWYRAHDGDLNAAWLVSELGRWQDRTGEVITYVSFNYDTILDNALADWYGWSWYRGDDLSLDAYVTTGSPFYLFKPHGSWNWAQPASFTVSTDPNRSPSHLERAAAFVALEGADVEYRWGEARLYPKGSGNLPDLSVGSMPRRSPNDVSPVAPALALPLSDKTRMVVSNTHQQELTRCLNQAKGVLSIGWHAGEEYIRKLLKENVPAGTSFALVSPNAADNARRLEGDLNSPTMYPMGMGFATFHGDNRLNAALESIYGPS